MKKILLPLEDTRRSFRAVDYVSKQYEPGDVEIIMLMVDENQNHAYSLGDEAQVIANLEKKLAAIAETLPGYKIRIMASTGKAGVKIARAVRETGADLIVMTKSSKEDMCNSIGSTTEYVLNNASCHVVIVSENIITNEAYRGLVYKTATATVNLRGQIGDKHSECLLPSVNVDCIYHFDVTVGKIRFMHTSYNSETKRWDMLPSPGQEVTCDILAGESVDILVKANSNSGKADRIRIVNRDMKKEAVFTYTIYATPQALRARNEAASAEAEQAPPASEAENIAKAAQEEVVEEKPIAETMEVNTQAASEEEITKIAPAKLQPKIEYEPLEEPGYAPFDSEDGNSQGSGIEPDYDASEGADEQPIQEEAPADEADIDESIEELEEESFIEEEWPAEI